MGKCGEAGGSGKRGENLEARLRDIYKEEVERTFNDGRKVTLSEIRRRLEKNLNTCNLTEQHIRDKLFTITQQERQRRGLINKGNGKGKGGGGVVKDRV